MKAKFLGALKAAAPFLLSLAYTAADALSGAPVDVGNTKALIAGAITSFVVYIVPNLVGGRVLGALKALVPTGLALLTIAINAAFGDPLDLSNVRTLVVGGVLSVVVYLLPNVKRA